MATLKSALTQKFRALRFRGKTKVKMPRFRRMRWIYPHKAELAYFEWIKKTIKGWYLPFEAEFARIAANYRPQDKQDDEETDWELTVAKLLTAQQLLFQEMSTRSFLGNIIRFGQDASIHNEGEFQKFMRVALGQDFPIDTPELAATLNTWAEENYRLIKSMTDTYITKTNDIVKAAVSKGQTYNEVMQQLRAAGAATSERHARLIARDQIGKLNSALTQQRQEVVGIDQYTWDTSGDERVRGNPNGRYPKAVPSHYAIDQKICRWDNAGVYKDSKGEWIPRTILMPTVHPGIDIQCRCAAIPYMDEIWAEAANAAQLETAGTDVGIQEQALNRLNAVPEMPDRKGMLPIGQFLGGVAGLSVLGGLRPKGSDFDTYGEPKMRNLSQVEALRDDVSKTAIQRIITEGFPNELPRGIVIDGKTYAMD